MSKQTWDEIQQTLMQVMSLGMWIMFEYWCFTSPEFAQLPHTPAVRLVLTNIITGIYAYIYTKSTNGDKNNG